MTTTPSFRRTALLLLGIISLLTACRRGEDDPFISFIPRRERLAENWELKVYSHSMETADGINIGFNDALCDTLAEKGNMITTLSGDHLFGDNELEITYTNAVGSQGTTRNFDIEFNYFIQINRHGAYSVQGEYNYYDDIKKSDLKGTFAVENEKWYWVDDDKDKAALRLMNFPYIDAQNLVQYGVPVLYVPERIFHLRELRKEKMVWEEYEDYNFDKSYQSDSFTAYDTVKNCVRTEYIFHTKQLEARWEFAPGNPQ